ncbi:MAG TPA: MFS transporter [Pirellulales bacterium]
MRGGRLALADARGYKAFGAGRHCGAAPNSFKQEFPNSQGWRLDSTHSNPSPDEPGAPPAPKFTQLATLFGLFYFLQGIGDPTDGLLLQPLRSLLMERKESAATISTFLLFLELPWGIKPLYGLISDFVPLAGYRRKSYLVLASAVSAVALFLLAAQPDSIDKVPLLLWLLPLAVSVAFSDVVIDALMIERGQPHGWTGQLQSLQWTALYGAAALAGWGGGYLSEHHLIRVGFLIVGIGSVVGLILSLLAHEDRSIAARALRRGSKAELTAAWRMPVLRAAALFLILWAFNPFSDTVLHVHMSQHLGFSEQFFGETVTWSALASMAGTLAYGAVRSRIKDFRLLLHAAIVLGIVSTIAYWAVRDEMSARATSAAAGFATALATLVQLDLAAQVCPPELAGTVFAVLMSLSNISLYVSRWLGGILYDRLRTAWGDQLAFDLLVALGGMTTAACWLVIPGLTRQLRVHDSRT